MGEKDCPRCGEFMEEGFEEDVARTLPPKETEVTVKLLTRRCAKCGWYEIEDYSWKVGMLGLEEY